MPESTVVRGARLSPKPLEVRHRGRLDYVEAFDEQHRLAARRADGDLDHDVLLLVEHPSVYTAGRRTQDCDRPVDGSTVIDVDRGGKITWHGPGQLVGYPIVALAEPIDVVDYVRRLEQALMDVCARWGLSTMRVPGRSGVWLDADPRTRLPQRKIAAIGIRVARGIAFHGFALNCDADLSAFSAIVPCGIPDAGVTSLSAETGRRVGVADVIDDVATYVAEAFDGPRPSVESSSITAADSSTLASSDNSVPAARSAVTPKPAISIAESEQ